MFKTSELWLQVKEIRLPDLDCAILKKFSTFRPQLYEALSRDNLLRIIRNLKEERGNSTIAWQVARVESLTE